MFGKIAESTQSTDIKPIKVENPEHRPELEPPSLGDLKSKLEDIFYPNSKEFSEARTTIFTDNSIESKDSSTVTLDDGTVITIAENSGTKQETTSTDAPANTDVLQNEVNPTRELTEDDKNNLKETLQWSNKQISKCTIDEDGVIHYRTDREDMEGKISENGILYERKTVDIHGIKVQGVFPVFDSAFDAQLPDDLEKASNAHQFKDCNNQLKEAIENNPELRDNFTEEQLEEIKDGDTPSGYVWHHNEEPGKMQLVKIEDHDRTQGGAAHTGGKALWGGGYSNHDTTETNSNNKTDATIQSTSSKEAE